MGQASFRCAFEFCITVLDLTRAPKEYTPVANEDGLFIDKSRISNLISSCT